MIQKSALNSIESRPIRRDDIGALEEIAIEGGFERHSNLTASEASEWVNRRLRKLSSEKSTIQSIVLKKNTPIGWIQVREIDERPGNLQLSYRFIRKSCSIEERATLIQQLVLSLFADPNIYRIETHFASEDQENRDIVIRVGFRLEGTLKQAKQLSSGKIDLSVFAALQSELPI